jgi:hypothetical protein
LSIESLPNALILALVAFQVLLTAFLATRTLPVMLKRSLDQAVDVALGAEKEAKKVREAWDEEKLRLEGILGALEDVRDQVEKKRSRAAAYHQRAQQAEAVGDHKQELRRRAGLA